MAITNAQQFKQLVNPPMDGKKRPGYRGDDAYGGGTTAGGSRADSPGDRGDGPARSGPTNNAVDTGDFGTEAENVQQNIAANLGGSGKSDPVQSVKTLQRFLNRRPTVKQLPPLGPFGIATNLFNKQFQRFADFSAKKNRDFFKKVIGAGRLNLDGKTIDLETIGQMTDEELEDTYKDYLSARANNQIDAYGNPINTGNDGGQQVLPIIPKTISDMTSDASDTDTEKEDMSRMFRLMADGGMTEDAPVGGIMDIESGRQMYGLGKLVKKATRAVKKIVKSPIGKAALASI